MGINLPRIAIDFDGVVADTMPLKQHWLMSKNLLAPSSSEYLTKQYLIESIGREAYARMHSEVGFEDTLEAPPVKGCVPSILNIYNEFDLYIISARPPEKIIWAKRWLVKNEIEKYFRAVLSSYGKEKELLALENECICIIDNDERHLTWSRNSGLLRILLHPQESGDKRIISVRSWEEVVDALRTHSAQRFPAKSPRI